MIARGADLIVNCWTLSSRLLFQISFVGLFGVWLATTVVYGFDAQPPEAPQLRVAVYDVPPYGYVNPDGSISGISADLWRRVAERLQRHFKLVPVSEMESILTGLEQGQFDAAIGAITITPEREKRVDFSYPAHRSGVAVALRKEKGPLSALKSYVQATSELSPLIISSLAMLVLIGIVMWLIERRHPSAQDSESSVVTLRDGLYWAIVTMTTVGYGDKTPKSTVGRHRRLLDVRQSGMGFAVVDQPGVATDRRARRIPRTSDYHRSDQQKAGGGGAVLGRRISRPAPPSIREIQQPARRAQLSGERNIGCGGQQRRRLAISDFKTLREHRGNAARPAGAGLYGDRATRA
jgi:hypothetical protein